MTCHQMAIIINISNFFTEMIMPCLSDLFVFQEWRERDSQRRPNPNEAIPMPYDGAKPGGEVVPVKGKARAKAKGDARRKKRTKSESALQVRGRINVVI